MKRTAPVKPPTRKELLTLWLMIGLGLVCMFFFLKELLKPGMIGNAPLYWMLIITIGFICLRVVTEWVHYLFITVPSTPPAEREFSVDIFTTYFPGEPFEMIVETLYAIKAITYPHTTYLCDEANNAYLRELCKQIGVIHVTRHNRIDAKAGNINNALKQSCGELCVVLDPDHVPFPDFLDPIVTHFNNPKIGFVQIVQAYRNHHENLITKGAAQQTFQFYGPMMMTMNKYGTVQAIGANCTFRRAALESIGGHAAGLAEDMHTAMQLHAKGWRSVYVPEVLARGLVPFTLSAYYRQQLKWARGVFELFCTTYPRLFTSFTWKQKLHYGLVPFYYLMGLIYFINFSIPILSLSFDVNPINIDVESFIILGFPLAIAIVLIRHFVQNWVMEDEERGFHVVGGLLSIGTWWIYLLGLICTITRTKIPYLPTPKNNHEDSNWLLNIPNILIIIASIAAIFYGLNIDWNPYSLIMAGFAGLNCLILLFSVVASKQHNFRRLKERNSFLNNVISRATYIKKQFWKVRRTIYSGLRSAALIISVLFGCSVLYLYKLESRHRLNEHRINIEVKQPIPNVQILVPAVTVFAHTSLTFSALIDDGHHWKFATPRQNLFFKWELVKTDKSGNPISMRLLGTEPNITFEAPKNPLEYRLYLYVSNGKSVKIVRSPLNLPLQ